MAAKKAETGTNRSEFIRKILEGNPGASLKDVVDRWHASGEKDRLNPTLYYQVKGHLGLTKKRKGGKRGRKPGRLREEAETPTENAPRMSNHHDTYLAIEQSLDGLIARAEEIRDSHLAGQLRVARRRASARLV